MAAFKLELEKTTRHIVKQTNIKGKIKGLRSLAEAIVTSGGVSTLEIDPSTMKSKIINNLSWITCQRKMS